MAMFMWAGDNAIMSLLLSRIERLRRSKMTMLDCWVLLADVSNTNAMVA